MIRKLNDIEIYQKQIIKSLLVCDKLIHIYSNKNMYGGCHKNMENSIKEKLNDILHFDEPLARHCMETALYTKRFMRFLGYTEDKINLAYNAALMHDIGKTVIKKELLYKTSKLTNDEKQMIDAHTINATNLLNDEDEFIQYVAIHHHDNYQDIDEVTQIIAICDTYSALITERSYKPAYAAIEAISIMKNDNRHENLNPIFVAAFEIMLRQFGYIM